MSSAPLGDVTCHYETAGAGRPLLLIAGLASDCASWAPLDEMLAGHLSVVTFDHRGVGRTIAPDRAFTIADLAEDAVKLLDHLGLPKASLLGHSLGGFVAMTMALRHPDRVERLVLAATAAACSRRNRDLFFRLAGLRTGGAPFETFLGEFFPWLFTPGFLAQPAKVRAALDAVLAYPHRQSAAGFRRQVEAAADFTVEEDLGRIAVPTTVIAGRHDILMTGAETARLAESIPGARLIILESAAHAIFAEGPAAFGSSVLDALGS